MSEIICNEGNGHLLRGGVSAIEMSDFKLYGRI